MMDIAADDRPDAVLNGQSTVQVSLRDVTVGYDGAAVLSGISVDLVRGDCRLLRGPNGSGKTTLLRTVAGLIPTLSGTMERTPGLALAYVPAEATLSPSLPLRLDEVALMGAFRDHPWGPTYPGVVREKARSLLERLGLSAKRSQAFNRSSSGEKQRTLLARALMASPDILLMDEPTSNLDRESLGYFMEMLQELHGEQVGMVISTHAHDLFASLSPRILEVRDGRLEAGP